MAKWCSIECRPSCVEKKSSRRMTGLASQLSAEVCFRGARGRNGAMHNVSISLPGCTTPSLRRRNNALSFFRARKCQVSERIEMGRVTQRGISMLSQPVRAQCCDLDGGPWQKKLCNSFTAAPHVSCCSYSPRCGEWLSDLLLGKVCFHASAQWKTRLIRCFQRCTSALGPLCVWVANTAWTSNPWKSPAGLCHVWPMPRPKHGTFSPTLVARPVHQRDIDCRPLWNAMPQNFLPDVGPFPRQFLSETLSPSDPASWAQGYRNTVGSRCPSRGVCCSLKTRSCASASCAAWFL